MSELTSAQWSVKTTEQLRAYEQSCSDVELFCVGYLMPPVDLLEIEYAEHTDSLTGWNELYLAFVEECMAQDQMAADDQQRIVNIVRQLAVAL